ncbi:hypothetical protein EOS_23520 [Caballeronia mineralivorans PML1(12)]|uniref:Uncharacterized protein n=1 Tax=Caballeronia mineralivorans PML1(12) TaxID=908627 RepID=A0A0J1FUX6_9BURK|nr:hypothetical protein [Caballeronia mineralivorans]KLU23633.1 hypothetical protein EOS_23520 [Caballeronia mineralivorans PML1(12)]
MQRTKTNGAECNAALGAYRLASENGLRIALRDLGMTQADPDRAADIVCRTPEPVRRSHLRSILHDAFDGLPPRNRPLPGNLSLPRENHYRFYLGL